MVKLVIMRHGESEANRDRIFTGWTDVPLTEKGIQQAHDAGRLIAETGLVFHDLHTSMLYRAIKTAHIVLEETKQLYIPEHKSWRLNERHYGALRGQNKDQSKPKWARRKLNYGDVVLKLFHHYWHNRTMILNTRTGRASCRAAKAWKWRISD